MPSTLASAGSMSRQMESLQLLAASVQAERQLKMLKNKASHSRQAQAGKYNDSREYPAGSNGSRIVEFVEVSKSLPMTSDDICCDSRIATGQVPRANQAFSNKAAFGQVLGFGFVSHESGVSGWSRGSKSLNGSVFGLESKRVLGVDSSNRRPVQVVCLEDIVNHKSFVANSYAGVPKKKPSKISKPDVNPGLSCNQEPGIYGQGGYSKESKDEPGSGHNATGSGVKSLSIHFPSLTQLATHRGECC